MAGVRYLYGAAVQGIQGFIFQTDKLKEIVGASELVEQICSSAFEAFAKNGEQIQRAAGCVKYIFDNENDCMEAVLKFPKKVMEMAPGITVSQAVVIFKAEEESDDKHLPFKAAVNELEQRLRIQRNKPFRSMTLGMLGVVRSRNTGLPATEYNEDEVLDLATSLKQKEGNKETTQKLCCKNFGEIELKTKQLALDIDKITGKNDWIAIIHIDGNGLGQIVQAIGTNKDQFKQFSKSLEEMTIASAQSAYQKVKTKFKNSEIIPMRPVVLSGDDHTLICRADLAIDYAEAFFSSFESETKGLSEILKEGNLPFDHLTACAGITFMKSSYPFHYGYHLAESLCKEAKEDAKQENRKKDGLPSSCLMFHKIQDSFVENYKAIVKRELKPQENLSFEFGPYYLEDSQKERWSIRHLKKQTQVLESKEGNALKSNLREWMSVLYDDVEAARQKLIGFSRSLKNNEKNYIKEVTDIKRGRIPVYDLLVYHTILNQKTKEDTDENN